MRSFFAKVEFTDANGLHPAGTVVNIPYTTDEDIANAQGLIRYGVITEQAPAETLRPNDENVTVLPPVEQQGSLAPNDENPVDASAPAPIEPVSPPEESAVDAVATDDPETPYFDARDESGQFVPEGTPVEEVEAPAEEVADEKPAPKKRASRKR